MGQGRARIAESEAEKVRKNRQTYCEKQNIPWVKRKNTLRLRKKRETLLEKTH